MLKTVDDLHVIIQSEEKLLDSNEYREMGPPDKLLILSTQKNNKKKTNKKNGRKNAICSQNVY